jgi:hypothetical protein
MGMSFGLQQKSIYIKKGLTPKHMALDLFLNNTHIFYIILQIERIILDNTV